MTPKDKRDYLEALLKAIVAHDDAFSIDMHTGAVCWEVDTDRTIYCTPAWEYIGDPSLELPDDGVIYISFYWVEDDCDNHAIVSFYTSYDNIVADMHDYMHIVKTFRAEYLK